MKKILKKRVLLPVAVVASLGASAIAFAAWTANGTGTATATAGVSQGVTLTGASASVLYPTGSADLGVTFSNPNPFAVTVTTVAQTVGQSITTGAAGCNASSVTFNSASGTGLSVRVPGKTGSTNGSATVTLTGALSMDNSAVDACQGATFSVPLSATAASSS